MLQGSCGVDLGEPGRAQLSTGDVAEVPAGDFALSVGTEGVVLVQVWDLRPYMD